MPTRTYSYTEPDELAAAIRELSYLEVLWRMQAGTLPLPSILESLDMRVETAESGHVVFSAIPNQAFCNPLGTLHGGWYATLLDSAVGSAIHSTLPAGKAQTTLEFKINMVRAAKLDGRPIRCEARARHVGRRTGTAEGDIVDADGKLLAHGSTTCLILEL